MSEMPAGRELDALVAEKVMGFRQASTFLGAYPRHHTNPESPELHQETPLYSTDIAAAWLVVERFAGERFSVEIQLDADGVWWVTLGNFDAVSAPTLPLAICRAALSAVGIEGETP